jgi:serine/threonine-protein kinase RsbW
MADDRHGLLIVLPAEPQNVALVRHAVAGLAEQVGMEEPVVGDLKTVVTEACMNVVVHAYRGEPGPLEVEVVPEPEELTVVVRDFGAGMRPRPNIENSSLRIGLTLIAALSSSFEIAGGLHRGTEITMRLPLRSPAGNGSAPESQQRAPAVTSTEVTIGQPDLVAPVLSRVVGALAARHQIPVDKLSDAVLLTDALSDRVAAACGGGLVSLGLSEWPDGIGLRLGPMSAGSAADLRDNLVVPGTGGSLEDLADGFEVESEADGEYVVIRFAAING